MSAATALRQVRIDRCHRTESHGTFRSELAFGDWSPCPKCPTDEWRRAEHTADRARWLRETLDAAQIPRKFAGAAFADAPPTLRAWTEALLEGNSAGPAVLVGGVGVGKTHAAAAALAHLIRDVGIRGRFSTVSEFGRDVRDQWVKRQIEESRVIERLALAPVLVLDDVGAHRALDTELLQELVAVRYAADLMPATIITSNLAAARFADAIGERAADRIREGATVIPMTGRSRRQAA